MKYHLLRLNYTLMLNLRSASLMQTILQVIQHLHLQVQQKPIAALNSLLVQHQSVLLLLMEVVIGLTQFNQLLHLLMEFTASQQKQQMLQEIHPLHLMLSVSLLITLPLYFPQVAQPLRLMKTAVLVKLSILLVQLMYRLLLIASRPIITTMQLHSLLIHQLAR